MMYPAGGEHVIVDNTVRIDHLVNDIPLFRIRFDAELDSLHHLIHDCEVYKCDRGVSEFSEFSIGVDPNVFENIANCHWYLFSL